LPAPPKAIFSVKVSEIKEFGQVRAGWQRCCYGKSGKEGGRIMSKKKAAKAKADRGIRNLPAKPLSAKHARGIRGGDKSSGMLTKACATGTHVKEATIDFGTK
jgi:hypothetical protein